ncbi:DNA-protecting protein DprA [Cohnella sp. AR92]|nr:DNA-protecting protein DprA [Cohnella sp. AR92]
MAQAIAITDRQAAFRAPLTEGMRGLLFLLDEAGRKRKMGQSRSEKELLIGMHETEGVGWLTIERILAGGALEGAERRREKDWKELALSAKQAENLVRRLSAERMEEEIERREKAGIQAITALDPAYPALLRQLPDAPWVLYYAGRLELLDRPALSIVGTRMATAYGKKVTEELSSACSAAGLTIVSGLARGIDTSAHAGALGKPGSTIAVLASPADYPYPPENRGLYREIASQGLILSEAPLGTPLTKGHFYLRNRIIAGLSQGTLVVEAGEGSGAMITAKHAFENDRDLFIVPGPITSPRSVGPLRLLREGAKPVMNADDILVDYERALGDWNARFSQPEKRQERRYSTDPEEERLSEAEESLYELLLEEPRTIDDLSERSGMSLGSLHTMLLSLQMKRLVQQLPGAVFAVV